MADIVKENKVTRWPPSFHFHVTFVSLRNLICNRPAPFSISRPFIRKSFLFFLYISSHFFPLPLGVPLDRFVPSHGALAISFAADVSPTCFPRTCHVWVRRRCVRKTFSWSGPVVAFLEIDQHPRSSSTTSPSISIPIWKDIFHFLYNSLICFPRTRHVWVRRRRVRKNFFSVRPCCRFPGNRQAPTIALDIVTIDLDTDLEGCFSFNIYLIWNAMLGRCVVAPSFHQPRRCLFLSSFVC